MFGGQVELTGAYGRGDRFVLFFKSRQENNENISPKDTKIKDDSLGLANIVYRLNTILYLLFVSCGKNIVTITSCQDFTTAGNRHGEMVVAICSPAIIKLHDIFFNTYAVVYLKPVSKSV